MVKKHNKMNCRILSILLPAALLAISCEEKPSQEQYDSMQGIIINEVSPAKTIVTESWIELYNTSDKQIKLNGMKLQLTTSKVFEEPIAELKEGVIEPNGRYVISSKDVEFAVPIIIADFEEVAIIDGDGAIINAFSVKYDLQSTAKPQDGGSFARIPDVTGNWAITETASRDARNYKIEPHIIAGMVINEVCPAEGWIELVNTYKSDAQMEYAYLKSASGETFYTFEEGIRVAQNERIVVECDCDAANFNEFTLYDNGGKKIETFSNKGLGEAAAGQSWQRLPDITGSWKMIGETTRNEVNVSISTSEDGLVLNEFSLAGWGEIANTTLDDIKTKGVTVKVDDKVVYESGAITIPAGKKISFSANVTSSSSAALYASNGTMLDSFNTGIIKNERTASSTTSWSRVPDGTGNWYTVITPSRDENNYGLVENNKIAIWVNHSSMENCDLEELCKLGIGNIIIHEFIFRSDKHDISKTKAFLDKAHKLGFKVHIWMQCFWWADTEWTSAVIDPVDGKPASYNYPVFNEIIQRGKPYLKYDIDGIHFDYIRFGGSAKKHNYPDQGVTAVGAITEFARMASETFRAERPDIVLSAALMGEAAPMTYYGQDPSQLSKYIDIFMPMAYISSYSYTSTKNVSVANWFADNDGNSETWHGFSTYNAASRGLSAAEILRDVKNVADNSRADGIALFRYGLGEYPDLNEFYK